MAKAKLVQKRMRVELRDIIRFQILTHCFMNGIRLNSNEIECLTLLGMSGVEDLAKFCNQAADEKIFRVPQAVRNFLIKAYDLKLVYKDGPHKKKKVALDSQLQIQTEGNIILDYKMYHVTQEQ
jgi:hypothetical protein